MSAAKQSAACLVFVFLALAGNITQSQAAERQTNVLFIAVDDLRPQLGCYGDQLVKTPSMDQLAAEGTVFQRAYCQQAVCSPSRTSLMTGLRPDSTKVYDLVTHFRDTVPNVVTLPEHFKAHGYAAIGFGKIYHGGLNDEKSWSVPWQGSRQSGYQLAENQQLIKQKRQQARDAGLKGKALHRSARGPAVEAADVPDEAYQDGDVTQMAIAALRRMQDRPFFLAVGFLKPHLPFNAPKRYWDLYKRDQFRVPRQDTWPQGMPPCAGSSWGELRNYEGIPKSGPVTGQQALELIHGYYACASYTDANVGRLLDELDKLGLSKNTVVVLWGDHGWKLGDYGAWCKHTNFELDARVPLIVRAPGQQAAGQPTDGLVEFVDIYPSLCQLAGLPLPEHLEGSSFAALLDDPAKKWKPAAFSQYPRSSQGRRLMGYSMRTDRCRYTEWQDRKTGEVAARELYDHSQGELPSQNLANVEGHAKHVSELSKQLNEGWRAAQPPSDVQGP